MADIVKTTPGIIQPDSPAALSHGRALLGLPFVYRGKDGLTYRYCVVQVNFDNHNQIVGEFHCTNGHWATGDDFTQAGIRWQRSQQDLDVPARDARGPDIGTAAWERQRANTFEAIISAINTIILTNGGFQWVQEPGKGERQESIPEAIARLCRGDIAESPNQLLSRNDTPATVHTTNKQLVQKTIDIKDDD